MEPSFLYSPDQKKESTSPSLLYPLLLLLVTFALYSGKLFVPFMWDDYPFILQNESIHSLGNIPHFFVSDTSLLYRPLRQTLYAFSYALSAENPLGYHLVGMFLMGGSVLAVYRLLSLLSFAEYPEACFAGSLLFALHPVHADRVMMITASYDLLGDLFTLLALVGYIAARQKKKTKGFFLLPLVLFALALFSSENAAMLPFLLAAWEWCLKQEEGHIKKRVHFLFPFFLLLVLYLLLRGVVLQGFARDGGEESSYFSTLFLMPKVILHYLLLLFAPLHLFTYRGMDVPPFQNLTEVLSFLLSFIICLVLVLWGIRGRELPLLRFGLLWFFIALLPVSNIIPIGTVMEERYLFLPSVALSVWFLALYQQLRGKKSVLFAAVLFALFLGALAAEKNMSYRSENEKWLHDFHAMVQTLSLDEWKNLQKEAEAFSVNTASLQAPARNKDRSVLCYQAGNALRELHPFEAESLYRLALVLNPRNYPAWHNLFLLIQQRHREADMQEGLLRITMRKDVPPAIRTELLMMRMEWCIRQKGKCWKEAFRNLNAMQKTFTEEQHYSILRNAGIAFMAEGNMQKAREMFLKALTLSKKEETILKKKIAETEAAFTKQE